MDILKLCAERRGVTGFALGDFVAPVNDALDEDQLLPLLILAAEESLKKSGMFRNTVDSEQSSAFPWQVELKDSDECLLNGSMVVTYEQSPIPQSVGLLFLDREIEVLVSGQSFDPETGIVALDYLLDSIEYSTTIGEGVSHGQHFSFE